MTYNSLRFVVLLAIVSIFGLLFVVVKVHAWDKNNPESIKDYIVYVASREDVNVGLAVAIAGAESNFIWNAKNPKSSASGVFQFINGTFLGYCRDKYGLAKSLEDKNNPFIQTNCAIYMLKEEGGHKHWLESSKGWIKFFSRELALQ